MKKVALLNLPFDNNYGGNLQRYALMKVVSNMGYDIYHIYLSQKEQLPWYKVAFSYSKRYIQRHLFHKEIIVFQERELNRKNAKKNELALDFYEKYIKHTSPCYSISDVSKVCKDQFQIFVVGSDQVWRKAMAGLLGIENYYLKFVRNKNIIRIAYSVSFGTEHCDYVDYDIKRLSSLYSKFNAVSVREIDALKTIEQLKWNNPKPILTLDPTFLLPSQEYVKLIIENNCKKTTKGKLFCYILDINDDIISLIRTKEKEYRVTSVIQQLDESETISIPQWIANIYYADYIVTDSYHGCVFSIIFNKPFLFVGNERRGNSRIKSLYSILGINETDDIDYEVVNKKIESLRVDSILFLKKSLSING